jgi:hypothetical protein
MITDGQQILIPDFDTLHGVWLTQKATVRKGTGEDRFHIEQEDGIVLWGVTADEVQKMMEHADRIAEKAEVE